MIRAYDESLLIKACDSLGRMLDFSVHSLHMDVKTMLELFIASGAASLFEQGDIRLIAGMSGIELAYEILDRSGMSYERQSPRHTISLSSEYQYGYDLAHKQWELCVSFDELISESAKDNMPALKKMRIKNGLSQSALAKASSVPVRTIQQYEQRQKDINRARAEYIVSLAAALNCSPSDLLSRD